MVATVTYGAFANLRRPLDVGPPARFFGSLGFDPSAGTVLLFGGGGASGALNDRWALSPNPEPARCRVQ